MRHSALLLPRVGMALARFCLAAWIGAAVLFVIVGVREVLVPEFTSEVKDRLVMLRFPAYYLAGASLLGVAFAATGLVSAQRASRGLWIAMVMLLLAGGLMAADYVWIYSPLAAMLTPPGQTRTAAFVTLHHWSMRINTVHLAACFIAAMVLLFTEPVSSLRDENAPGSLSL